MLTNDQFAMDDKQFAKLLEYFNFSWRGYKKVRKGVKKRVARHMQELDCRNIDGYMEKLENDQAIRLTCAHLLTVSISRFFRDRKCWEILQDNILPGFMEKEELIIWSAGCAGGEEVYTIKIIWEMLSKEHPHLPFLNLVATDLNPENLERSRAGVYKPSSLKEVGQDLKDRFFHKGPGKKSVAVIPKLKNGIIWKVHDLLKDQPPKNEFDIIFLRNNILTYSLGDLKQAGFLNAVSALSESGILVIGSKERLPEGVTGFDSEKLPYVFLKNRVDFIL